MAILLISKIDSLVNKKAISGDHSWFNQMVSCWLKNEPLVNAGFLSFQLIQPNS